MRLWGNYNDDTEEFFVFIDKRPVLNWQLRKILRLVLNNLGLESELYDVHSLRIGRSCEMFKLGYTVEQIKFVGQWKSNAVYRYLRN